MDEKRYKGICPVCGKELWICKSVAMQIGWNVGTGICTGCKTLLCIEYNPERQEMDLMEVEKYVERQNGDEIVVVNSCGIERLEE